VHGSTQGPDTTHTHTGLDLNCQKKEEKKKEGIGRNFITQSTTERKGVGYAKILPKMQLVCVHVSQKWKIYRSPSRFILFLLQNRSSSTRHTTHSKTKTNTETPTKTQHHPKTTKHPASPARLS
jgi:hypothetical protein